MFALDNNKLKVTKMPDKTFELNVNEKITVAEFGRLVNRFLEMPNELFETIGSTPAL